MKKMLLVVMSFIIVLGIGIGSGFIMSSFSLKGVSIGYVGIGHEYVQKKDYIGAIANFNKAVALNDNSFIAHISLADTYYSTKSYELALEEYETSLKLSLSENGKSNNGEKRYITNKIDELKKILNKKS